ncbi:hypothetical protein F2Q69_00035464 [Brassica cretica]|uniref:Uncharacterized protein n=1 Tax=Brassica cretica TaxID=69181 RepID=A0A8S9SEY0_BRACR|nr:hypothetical protein F2Q69_00035464 [Brassica cretica]
MSLMLNGDFLWRLLRRLKLKVKIKSDKKLDGQHCGSWFQRHAEQRGINKGYEAMAFPEFAPRHFPKNTNPKLVNRNRRMLETIPYHSSGGDSDELIRAEDNVKERKLGEKESRSCRFLCSRDNNNVQEKTTQNLLELIRPVRFYATVDSVLRVSGEINLPKEGSKVSMKPKEKIFGRYLDLFPNLDHWHKGGVRLESLESSKDTQEGKNESSAETDTLEMDKLQMMRLSGIVKTFKMAIQDVREK